MTEKLRTIIIDDEPLAVELLCGYVQQVPFLQLQQTFTNPLEALPLIQQGKADLLLLDIEMPQLNGIKLMELMQGKTNVIFTTAYPNYALKGFELEATDYLLKPVSFERFLKAVMKILPKTTVVAPVIEPAALPNDNTGEFIFVKDGYRLVKILLRDILLIEGLKEYVAIHSKKEKVVTLQTLKSLEDILPRGRFIRVHKSFIISFDKIDAVEGMQIFIAQHKIPIGGNYKNRFFELLDQRKLG